MNRKLLRGILLLILGVAIIVVTAIIEQNSNNSFRAGMFTGVGAGVIIIAVIYIVKLIQYKKYPAKLKKDEMMSTEERQIMIKDKASSIAFAASGITSSVVIMILAAINAQMEIILIVCGGMLINIVIFFFMLYHYSKKY